MSSGSTSSVSGDLGAGALGRVRGSDGHGFSREAVRRGVGQPQQLLRQLACVLDDPVTLGPDPVGLSVELADPLLGRGHDLSRLLTRGLQPVLGLAAGLGGDPLAGLVGALKDSETSSPTRSSARRIAASGERVTCSSATSWAVLRDVGVDREPVIPAQNGGEFDVGDDRQGVVGQGRERPGDLLDERVFGGG